VITSDHNLDESDMLYLEKTVKELDSYVKENRNIDESQVKKVEINDELIPSKYKNLDGHVDFVKIIESDHNSNSNSKVEHEKHKNKHKHRSHSKKERVVNAFY
jgi:hypothetical protein